MPAGSENNIVRFLLILCNDSLTEAGTEEAVRLASGIREWERFSDLAVRNGIAAFIIENIIENNLQHLLPAEELNKLQAFRNKTLARVTFLNVTAAEISGTLAKHGIKTVLLKGAALEATVYGNKGLRQMNDIDILVSEDRSIEAWDILRCCGYEDRPLKSPLYKKIVTELGNHLPELHARGISVDIHHSLFQKHARQLTARGIEEALPVDVCGVRCYVLPPRLAFLGMIKHIQKHGVKGEFQVRLYLDLFLLLKHNREQILCPVLAEEAEEAGISKDLSAVLYLLTYYFKADIPPACFSDVADRALQKYRSAFYKGITNPGRIDVEKNRYIYEYNLNAIKGMRSRLIFLAGDIFPSVHFMKQRYRTKNLFMVLLHYPLRAGKLFWFIRGLIRGYKK